MSLANVKLVSGKIVSLPADEKAALEADQARLTAELVRTKYKRDRRQAYPPITDQLDEIWKLLSQIADGNPIDRGMIDQIAAIKAQFPKPPDG